MTDTTLIRVTAQNFHQYLQTSNNPAVNHPAVPIVNIAPNLHRISYQFTANIWSVGSGLYVSEEQDYAGGGQYMLRARSSSAGAWEQFNVYVDGNGQWYIQSANTGLFVSEEQDYTGEGQYMLRARTPGDALGTWEQFSMIKL